MQAATSSVEVGVREFKNHLSRYLERAQDGEVVVVTQRGRPIARLTSVDASTDRLAELVASGAVRPPMTGTRRRPVRRIPAAGAVSDLVADQRR